jgi:hypothetical protein
MLRRICSTSLLVLLAACGSKGPVFSFGPTSAPMRYQVDAYSNLLVETPDGNQASRDTVRSTLTLDIGDAVAGGRRVTAQFEGMEVKTVGDMGSRRLPGDELVGKPFTGTLKQDGSIEVTDAPQLPRGMRDLFDPAALFVEMLAPLPPDANASAASWPHRSVVTSKAGMDIVATYEGTARFAGDSTWNGQPVRIIASEGTVELKGEGTPPGAPGAIEMTLEGKVTRRYYWDAMRGVMLASVQESEAEGVIVVLDFDIAVPTSLTSVQRVTLRP